MWFWWVMLIICTLTVLLVLGFIHGLTSFPKSVKHIIEFSGGYCMGIFLYLLLFSLAADLLLLVPKWMKIPF
jgi:hypothetical protein